MRVILFTLVLLTFISCNDGTKQNMAETAVATTDFAAVKDEWVADFKKFREDRSRKLKKTFTNEDIFHNLLIFFFSIITSLREVANTPKKDLLQEVLPLVLF